MRAYATCSASLSATLTEKFEATRKSVLGTLLCALPTSVARRSALALVALPLFNKSRPPAPVLRVRGGEQCMYVCGLGVLRAQPSQVGDARVQHGRGLARRGKLQPVHISTELMINILRCQSHL